MRSDELTKLALKAAAGDEDALDALVKNEKPYLDKWLGARCGANNPLYSEIEDISQEIMVQLVRSIGSFKGEASFPTWWNSLRWKRWCQFLRARAAWRRWFVLCDYDGGYSTADLETMAGGCEVESELESQEEFDYLVGLANERSREVLRLRYGEGEKLTDIAKALGIGYEKARSRSRWGEKRIREKLRRMEK
jgi:RNA polymerase sigma-70 factor (ECF subfamily)